LQGFNGEELQIPGANVDNPRIVLAERDDIMKAFLSSDSWRLTNPLRWFGTQARRAKVLFKTLHSAKVHFGDLKTTLFKLIEIYKREGLHGIRYRIRFLLEKNLYAESLAVNIFYNQQKEFSREEIEFQIEYYSRKPLISIIMPVFNTSLKWLELAIKSLQAQMYKNWELCAVDDCSTKENTKMLLEKYAKVDARIRFYFSPQNEGISAASNFSLKMAKGEYIALFDHDDELTPDALFWVVKEINEHPSTEFIYSDECKIDDTEKRKLFNFIFKPDWSPEMLLNSMYTGHLTVYKKKLVVNLGGFRSEYDFSQDYDLALRASEKAENIRHIERVLYLWRAIDGSAAKKGGKDFARIYNQDALKDAFLRRNIDANIIKKTFVNYPDITIKIKEKISIVIPTDSYENLKRSIDSILLTTAYDNYEIVAVCNSKLANKIRPQYIHAKNIYFSYYDKPFNFSDKCNQGASDSSGDILIFYNDDVIPLDPSWLEKLIEYLYLPGVGGVSPKLIFENGKIQYAGMISGTPDFAGTPYNGYDQYATDLFLSMHRYIRNISVLSGACCAIRKNIFNSVGGYDSFHTPNGHSDIDLSFRILDAGLRCVYTPHAVLTHIGNHTWHVQKGQKDKSDIFLLKKWGKYLCRDPYFTDVMKSVLYRDFTYKFKIFAKTVDSEKNYRGKDILLVSHELSLTGAPRVLLNAAKILKTTGFFPVVIAPDDGPMRKEFEDEGIAVIVDEMLFRKHWLTERFMKNFDLILVNTQVGIPIVKQMKEYKIPIILWLHEAAGLEKLDHKNKNAFESCNSIILVSDYAKQFLSKFSEKISILQNGLKDISLKAGTKVVDSSNIRFCIIGTIEPRKGQDIFIDAVLKLPEKVRQKATFLILGKVWPAFIPYYKNLTKKSTSVPEIKYLNTLPYAEIIKFIESCDVLVCPSRDEPASLVTIEAMMCNKPVIISNKVGVGDRLKHDVSCLRFISENTDELSKCIEFFIERPDQIAKFGNEAREVYEKEFTLDRFNKDFLDIINDFGK
jgi:GT2 family glycosyltransferase